MEYTFGFIGCGNMGGALVRAVAKSLDKEKIAVCDHNEAKTTTLEKELGVKTLNAVEIAQTCRFIVLGVKPQNMQATLVPLAPILRRRENMVIISMAAGVSVSAVRAFLGANLPVIRIMPNTPALLGKGLLLYSPVDVDEQTQKDFSVYFAKVGTLDKIPEEKIDAASALSGCGPAFAYAFAGALADGAVECGLSEDKAAFYAAQTLLGAAEMLLAYKNPTALIDAVCSPGGTTIAGMRALEKAKLHSAAKSAVIAAYNRTLELKK